MKCTCNIHKLLVYLYGVFEKVATCDMNSHEVLFCYLNNNQKFKFINWIGSFFNQHNKKSVLILQECFPYSFSWKLIKFSVLMMLNFLKNITLWN